MLKALSFLNELWALSCCCWTHSLCINTQSVGCQLEARVSTEADDSLHFVVVFLSSFFWVTAATFAKCDTEATVRNGVGIKMDYTLKTEKLKSGCLAALSPRPTAWPALLCWHLPQLVLLVLYDTPMHCTPLSLPLCPSHQQSPALGVSRGLVQSGIYSRHFDFNYDTNCH